MAHMSIHPSFAEPYVHSPKVVKKRGESSDGMVLKEGVHYIPTLPLLVYVHTTLLLLPVVSITQDVAILPPPFPPFSSLGR